MERQYKTIKTPKGNNEVRLKSWLTGREKREIQSVYLQDVDFNANAKDKQDALKDYKIAGGKFYEAQDKTIQIIVDSIDGTQDKILDRILSMHATDFDFVIGEINKITAGEEEASDLKGQKKNTVNS